MGHPAGNHTTAFKNITGGGLMRDPCPEYEARVGKREYL